MLLTIPLVGAFETLTQKFDQLLRRSKSQFPPGIDLFDPAVMAGDDSAAMKHLEWARDRPREFEMVGARAQASGWAGKVGDSRRLYEDAARMAEGRNLPDVGTSHLAWASWTELVCGNIERAAQLARGVLDREPSYDPRLRAALTLALTGADCEAEAIANELAATNPEHTFINSVLVPIVRAGVDLGRARPGQAIEHLRVVAPYELGFIAALAPIYLRGLSYLMIGSGLEAAAEFQRLLPCRGSDPFSPFHAVAPLGLARALTASGNVAGAAHAYERFLAGWGQADADVPVLLEAREEYERLWRRGRLQQEHPRADAEPLPTRERDGASRPGPCSTV